MKEMPTRVLLVDDHAVVRSGLAAFLMVHEDMQLVGEASSGDQAVALCEKVCPDVILMDLVMPGMNGVEATQVIRKKHPEVQVIVLTSFTDQEMVQNALQAGANGYLLKDVSASELAEAIRNARNGKPTLSAEATQALIQAAIKPVANNLGFDLTEREREVLALMSDGYSNQQIAERLVVSLSTAKFHVSSIISKLGASSRTEAVSLALKNKIINN